MPLPSLRLVQPSGKRRRARTSHQPLSQPGEDAQAAVSSQTAPDAPPAQSARSARPPRYQQQRPRPLPPRSQDPPLYRRSPVTESPLIQVARATPPQQALACAGPAAVELTGPYLHQSRWLVYLRALVAAAIALFALSYIVMSYET
ncbi:MAG TPA: hypothetical protein VNO30_03690 [Kofleriaceae bacterium]|nr:hypothetical protein [Kofleriaceae bacterium]